MKIHLLIVLGLIICLQSSANAHEGYNETLHAENIEAALEKAKVSITTDENYRYITSNGIPNHETGQFPNRGNPNTISSQNHKYRVSLKPIKNTTPKEQRGVVGIALNGIPFEPGTAEFWNNDRSSGLNYEALSGKINLGLDRQNAHVQPTGTYHYHGIPNALAGDTLKIVGYAADGFPLYAGKSHSYKSSYTLKSGQRPNGPRGTYDGTFTSDYKYTVGTGNLDECNGTIINGSYGYIITQEFPHIPRCLFGTVDSSFERRRPPPDGRRRGHRPPPPHIR